MTVSSENDNKLHPNYSCCGIDISQWNEFTYPQMAKDMGVKFVIARAGYGVFEDKKLHENIAICNRENIPIFFYWYWLPQLEPKKIAEAVRRVLNYGNVLFLDVEKNNVDKWPTNMTPKIVTEHLLETLDECDGAFGKETGIYTSPGFWGAWIVKTQITKFRLPRRKKWTAQWTYSYRAKPQPLPYMWGDWDLWQFSGTIGVWSGKAKQFGITKSYSVDVNAYNGTYDQLCSEFGISNNKNSEPYITP